MWFFVIHEFHKFSRIERDDCINHLNRFSVCQKASWLTGWLSLLISKAESLILFSPMAKVGFI
ncbi:hypothetical protein SAMN06265379_10110 [Saccharicrinis carchari]|uniref:Uncharacterized protein n=1 Tax=Saccharicrinis carchari TaxID=1168039 RepID=A0A521ABL5_SACCC|nr:hypothetical protein SAMN06265379_10110 [Saccharicrinis carchari]